MKRFAALLVLSVTTAFGQGPEPDISDRRISQATLVREDLFAGFLDDNAVRLARAERNLEQLLTLRPDDRPYLLAWQGEAAFYHAVRAYERGDQVAFREQYRRARRLFAEAKQ